MKLKVSPADKRLILVAVIATILLIPLYAQSAQGLVKYQNKCYGDILAREAVVVINGNSIPINNTIVCEYGCDENTNECRAPSYQGWLVVAGILGGILIVGALIAKAS